MEYDSINYRKSREHVLDFALIRQLKFRQILQIIPYLQLKTLELNSGKYVGLSLGMSESWLKITYSRINQNIMNAIRNVSSILLEHLEWFFTKTMIGVQRTLLLRQYIFEIQSEIIFFCQMVRFDFNRKPHPK